MPRPNWTALSALAVSLLLWALAADATYRIAHHGHGGLRHAIYARAAQVAHRLERAV